MHRTYLLDGLILSSSFSGLLVWWCLVCLSPCPVPLWPGFQRIQDVLPARGRLHFPCPIPVTLQGVCALPHSPLSLTPCDLGRGATSTFLFRFQGLLGKGCEQVRSQSLGIPMLVQPWGGTGLPFCCLPMCPVGPYLVLRRSWVLRGMTV